MRPPFLHTGYELGEAINSPTHGVKPKVIPISSITLSGQYLLQIPQTLDGLGHCSLRRKYSISQPIQKKRLVNQIQLSRAAEGKTLRRWEAKRYILIWNKI